MCGIFGCIARNAKAAPIIHAALKRLEYRGYDSVGIATIHKGKIYIKKDSGKIDDVHKLLNLDDMPLVLHVLTQLIRDSSSCSPQLGAG